MPSYRGRKEQPPGKVSGNVHPAVASPSAPPDSPVAQVPDPIEFARQLLDALHLERTKSASPDMVIKAESDVQHSAPIVQASRMEVKEVHEIWDTKEYRYTIIKAPPTIELTELDAYAFVVRTCVDKTSLRPVVHVDIKSGHLRDALKVVFKDVGWVSLSGDKPSIEANLSFHYLPELEAFRANMAVDWEPDCESLLTLDLLISTVRRNHRSTVDHLLPLLDNGMITYDLLWALFKANDLVISTCQGSAKARCLSYEMGEEKANSQGVEYFELQCEYRDFDGKVFGAVTEKISIEKFGGARQITYLPVYPLHIHPNYNGFKKALMERGQKFVDLIGSHHRHFEGHAFFQGKQDLTRMPINSRIMVDAEQFRKSNSNYPRLIVRKSTFDLSFGLRMEETESERVTSKDLSPSDLSEVGLITCAPTVLAFSLDDKFWAEYAVDDIRTICWSDLPMTRLTIPVENKEAIIAVSKKHLKSLDEYGMHSPGTFDDVVEGKGRGINILLHGPRGVGKTLTAEALSEHFRRPLYSVSTGDLSSDAAELERKLTHIFQTAHAWNALLLLDQADVFLQRRAEISLERNRLVGVFLRKMEYYAGVLFLTTNLAHQFDDAILDRMHLMMKYEKLGKAVRQTIITNFLKTVGGGQGLSIGQEYISRFATIDMNGRQIKNTLALSMALATAKREHLASSHISHALTVNGRIVPSSDDASGDSSLYD